MLFLDGFYRDWLAWFVEARADHGAPFREHAAVGARLEQYWFRVMIPEQAALNFQAGKFSAPIGNFLPRHSPRENPMTTFPLPYDQVTTFMYKLDTAAVVLGRRDRPDVKDWRVPIWQEVYGTGVMAFGKTGDFSYAVAAMNSAPGTWAFDWDYHSGDFKDPNVYLRAGYAFGPGTKLGATWSRGPYDREDSHGIPAGRDTGDFPQTLAGVDFEYSRGDLDMCRGRWVGWFPLSGELLWNPEDEGAPYGLVFQAAKWTRIPPVSVPRFRGWRYLETAPDAGASAQTTAGRTPSSSS